MYDFKKFWLEFTEIKCFEIGLCDGKNQLLLFWNERFMPEAFENQEGLSFENMDNFVGGFESIYLWKFTFEFKKWSMIFFE
mgnify:CR=1 FL=1